MLLREHDNAEQAAKYAERKAEMLRAMGNATGLDYAAAATALRALQAGQRFTSAACRRQVGWK